MCGRFQLDIDPQPLAEYFGLPTPPWPVRRNSIAPTQRVPVVRRIPGGTDLDFVRMRWGLVPAWAREASIGSRMINARAETAAEKPAFRHAMRHRRCLVPATGFYEWRKEGRRKQPYLVRLGDGGVFAFAGLWERWSPPGAEPLETFTILTTAANDLVASLHDRMPVILDRADHDRWLRPDASLEDVQSLLVPYPSARMVAFPVRSPVNHPEANDPQGTEAVVDLFADRASLTKDEAG